MWFSNYANTRDITENMKSTIIIIVFAICLSAYTSAKSIVGVSVPNYPCTSSDISKLYPNPSDPATFYQCATFGLVLFQCPANLEFSVETNQCDWPLDSPEEPIPEPVASSESEELVPDPVASFEESSPTDAPTPTKPQTVAPTDAPTPTKLHTVAPTDAPTPTKPQTVAPTDAPTPTKPQTVAPTDAPTPTKPQTATTDAPALLDCSSITCRTNPENMYHPHPSRCDAFCQCSNEIPYQHLCPSGLHFNARINVCDWPRDAQCPYA